MVALLNKGARALWKPFFSRAAESKRMGFAVVAGVVMDPAGVFEELGRLIGGWPFSGGVVGYTRAKGEV